MVTSPKLKKKRSAKAKIKKAAATTTAAEKLELSETRLDVSSSGGQDDPELPPPMVPETTKPKSAKAKVKKAATATAAAEELLDLSVSETHLDVSSSRGQDDPELPPPMVPGTTNPLLVNGNSAAQPSSHRIEERLTKALEAAPAPTRNRSSELIPLTADYEAFKTRVRNLLVTMESYKESTNAMHTSRMAFVQQLGNMSEKTPMYDHVGMEIDGAATEALDEIMTETKNAKVQGTAVTADDNKDGQTKKTVGMVAKEWETRHEAFDSASLSVLESWSGTQAAVNANDFQTHVIQYTTEWQSIVTTRIEDELKSVRKLQRDRSHYVKKVESLRSRVHELENKGKTPPQKQLDHLQRNEDKLKEAYTIHEAEAGKVCILIEEVVHRGWLELYTLVRNYMKWESNRVGRESDIYGRMALSLEAMKSTLKHHSKKKA